MIGPRWSSSVDAFGVPPSAGGLFTSVFLDTIVSVLAQSLLDVTVPGDTFLNVSPFSTRLSGGLLWQGGSRCPVGALVVTSLGMRSRSTAGTPRGA